MILVTAFLGILMTACVFKVNSVGWSERRFEVGKFNQENTLSLRGILAALIVLHHLSMYFPLSVTEQFRHWGGALVAVFFFITGYGLAVSYRRKGVGYLDGFLRKRLSGILPQFIVLVLLYSSGYCLFMDYSIKEIMCDLANGRTLSSLPNSWFIYVIIYVYVAFYVSLKLCGDIVRGGALFVCMLAAYVVFAAVVFEFSPHWWYTVMATGCGYFLAVSEDRLESSIARRPYVVIGLLAVLTVVCSALKVMSLLSAMWFYLWVFLFHMLVPVIVYVSIVIMAQGNPQYGRKRGQRLLRFLGTVSLELYLVHGVVIYLCDRFDLGAYPAYPVVFACSVAGAWLLARLSVVWRRDGKAVAVNR